MFWTISDLGLAHNFFDLGLAAGSNHIYPGHMMANITNINVLYFTWYLDWEK